MYVDFFPFLFFSSFFMHDFAFTTYFFRFNAFMCQPLLSSIIVHICTTTKQKCFFSRLSNRNVNRVQFVCLLQCALFLHKSIIFRITASTNFTCLYPKMQCNAWICMLFFASINILKFSANVFRLQYLPLYPLLHSLLLLRDHRTFCFCSVGVFSVLLRFHSFFMWIIIGGFSTWKIEIDAYKTQTLLHGEKKIRKRAREKRNSNQMAKNWNHRWRATKKIYVCMCKRIVTWKKGNAKIMKNCRY